MKIPQQAFNYTPKQITYQNGFINENRKKLYKEYSKSLYNFSGAYE